MFVTRGFVRALRAASGRIAALRRACVARHTARHGAGKVLRFIPIAIKGNAGRRSVSVTQHKAPESGTAGSAADVHWMQG